MIQGNCHRWSGQLEFVGDSTFRPGQMMCFAARGF